MPEASQKPGERLLWADALRVVAVFAVVMLHSAAPLLVQYRTAGPTSWWVGNAYDSAVRWCVPLFVMLSGALLLQGDRPLRGFFRRRVRRVVVPLVIWSAVYFWWARLFRGRSVELADFLEGPIYYHLWFFYMILGLYLLVPLLRATLRAGGVRGAWCAVGLWLVLASVAPIFAGISGRDSASSLALSPLQLVGYLLLGHLLREVVLSRRQTVVALGVFLVGWCVTAAGTWFLTVPRGDGKFDGLFYEYFAANVLVMTVAVFLLGRSLRLERLSSRSSRAGGWLRAVSASTLGVYVVHAMVIDLFKSGVLGVRIDQAIVHPALGIPLFALAVFGLSLVVVLALKRIPLVGRAVP